MTFLIECHKNTIDNIINKELNEFLIINSKYNITTI